MENMGYQDEFINMCKTLYEESESCVLNDGLTTNYFNIEKSCKQGDCLSPYLFIIALEPLLQAIKNNEKLKGITIDGIEHKLAAYADDLTIMLDEDSDIDELFKILEDFKEVSGL